MYAGPCGSFMETEACIWNVCGTVGMGTRCTYVPARKWSLHPASRCCSDRNEDNCVMGMQAGYWSYMYLHSFTHTHWHTHTDCIITHLQTSWTEVESAKETDNEKNIDLRMLSAALLPKDHYWSWATCMDAVGIQCFHCYLLGYNSLLIGWTELVKVSHITGIIFILFYFFHCLFRWRSTVPVSIWIY